MQHFDDFAQMQRDAERRVMEMQRRAMAAVDSVEYHEATAEKPDSILPSPESTQREPIKANPPAAAESLDPLKKLGFSDDDSESMMLIIIILLLLREEADEKLILALLYILL